MTQEPERRWQGVRKWMARQPEVLIYFVSLLLLSGVVLGDWLSGPDLGFRLFYLIPMIPIAWRCGRTAGVLFALLSALAWIFLGEERIDFYGRPALPFWNMTLEIGFFLIVAFLVDIVRHEMARVDKLSQTDVLTGVANRRYFRIVLEEAVAQARCRGRSVSLAYLDLDNFKEVNDTRGHLIGDQVLCASVQAIRAEIRQSDLLARLGGDEFAVLLPESDAASAESLMIRVRERLAQLFQFQNWPVTVSIGAVTFHEFPATTDEIIDAADMLMYSVKNEGKNGLRVETWPVVRQHKTRSGRAHRISRANATPGSGADFGAAAAPIRRGTSSGRHNSSAT